MAKTLTKRISLKRIGLTDNYKVASLSNQKGFSFEGRSYLVGDLIQSETVDKLCESEKFNVTVR